MKKKGVAKKRKLKNKVRFLIKFILVFFILFLIVMYLYNLPIRNIYIKGNDNVEDIEIIEAAHIKNYPKIFCLSTKKMKKNISELPLISEVKIKRNIFGKLTIEVKEEKILMYYRYINKYITSEGNTILDSNNYYGYATLINFTPDTILEGLIQGLNKVDYNIIRMINEIEYTPYKSTDGTLIDDSRFTLMMNDGNKVIIDVVNIKKLNDYLEVYASLSMDTVKGTLYLDTITDDNIYFKSFETEQKEKEEAQKKEETDKKETGD